MDINLSDIPLRDTALEFPILIVMLNCLSDSITNSLLKVLLKHSGELKTDKELADAKFNNFPI